MKINATQEQQHHSHENKQESKEGEVGVENDAVETW